MKFNKEIVTFGLAAIVLGLAHPAQAGFVDYVIRGTPGIDTSVAGQTEFMITSSGDKAGLGSNDINGRTLGSITGLSIDRLDDRTRFAPGSGPYVAPYLNFWITDGAGHYAVVANEPSNPDFQSLYNGGYDLDFDDLSDKVAKIFENSDTSWIHDPTGGILTFGDLADYVIEAPSIAKLNAGWGGLGGGAPRELGTNVAYGVNWVFGDTLSNYVSGDPGYIVANAAVTAVPEPGTLILLGSALAGLGVMRRRQKA
jgi:hypothetical protein